MHKNKAIQVRLDPNLKEEVENIFSELGMSTSQAICIFLKQVQFTRSIPFEIRLPSEPNELTKATLEKSRRGEGLTEYNSTEEMFDSWDKL